METTTVLDSTDPTTDEQPADPHQTQVAALADAVVRAMHTLQRVRAQRMAHGDATEWNTRMLLAKIVTTGPKRVSELAELVHVDASTVSRQVAAMVKDGVLHRTADPDDGRASLVASTEHGREVFAGIVTARNAELGRALHDWSVEDTATLARLLDRFSGAISAAAPHRNLDGDAVGKEN